MNIFHFYVIIPVYILYIFSLIFYHIIYFVVPLYYFCYIFYFSPKNILPTSKNISKRNTSKKYNRSSEFMFTITYPLIYMLNFYHNLLSYYIMHCSVLSIISNFPMTLSWRWLLFISVRRLNRELSLSVCLIVVDGYSFTLIIFIIIS